ncbi:threonine--tRNA ligase [Patescibacteria group bacterium]|nr:threonine--tRNA ligase [Patescibacteria group bacterium]
MDDKLQNLRHSTAHLLAAAVTALYPNALPTIGPAIESGFYYDFDNLKISDGDLPKIEEKMREIAPTWQKFEKKNQGNEAIAKNPYKKELIAELKEKGEPITYYQSGDFIDLCRGGHSPNPAKDLQHFKLLKLAGAYWRGNEKNKMLTRIYGTAFTTKKELDNYLKMLEEAEKRDHKKLGLQMGLFMFHETAPGMPYWLPKGVVLYNELINFWREEHEKRGYVEITSPLINKKELYLTSGHWDHYKENMFIAKTEEGEVYALKPMNCPNAMVVFGSKTRSYKELPLRLGDTDCLHRYELSGTLNGLFRVREFRQDDAHIYVSEDQIEEEFKRIFEITRYFYSLFGMEYRFRLGTRPDDLMGDPKVWDKAEAILEKIVKDSGHEYFIGENEGAFYGPKIDILMKDALGREWQTGTIQLDFQMPLRFNLKYSAANGSQKTPAVIHRVIYGSLERFVGIMLEHLSGNLPTWLAPVQAEVLPIADRHLDYARSVKVALESVGVRAELDDRSEKLGAKIRDAQMQKVPYMLVIGDKEVEEKTVSVRSRDKGDLGSLPLKKFLEDLKIEIKEKKIAKTVQS